MAVLHGLLTLLVLLALVCLPCLIAVVLIADSVVAYALHAVARLRRRWVEGRLARRAGLGRKPLRREPTRVHQPVGPPIEQIAADLRRLARQRTGVATRSPVWFSAVSRAYDERLTLACCELEIPEHLCELTGLDLEIERVRVEGMLLAAGLSMSTVDSDRRRDVR